MTTQPLPVTEVARRLCEAHHPHLATTGAVIPCGPHTTIARTHYGLLTPEGDKTWAVFAAIRADDQPEEDAVACDHHRLPLVVTGETAWHVLVDPEGVEGTQRVPCPLFAQFVERVALT